MNSCYSQHQQVMNLTSVGILLWKGQSPLPFLHLMVSKSWKRISDGTAMQFQIPISDIPAGLYVLNIKLSNGESINLKAIKQ